VTMLNEPEWLQPHSLEEALELKAERAEEATVVAGGTFVGILMNQGLLAPATLLSLAQVRGLGRIEANGELQLGALVTHRAVELSPVVRERWPALARSFSVVASPRVRNQATVGGVLADADYASDPPAMLMALDAVAVARSAGGERAIPVAELIVGHYETTLEPDELIVEVRVPGGEHRAAYRKFRSRSREDRPCVAVASAWSSAPSPTGPSSSRSCATRTLPPPRSGRPTPTRSIRSRTFAGRRSTASA
jgi:carbon-monoxide dehydrogenase medium subunit